MLSARYPWLSGVVDPTVITKQHHRCSRFQGRHDNMSLSNWNGCVGVVEGEDGIEALILVNSPVE
jgi:hypothetical protein